MNGTPILACPVAYVIGGTYVYHGNLSPKVCTNISCDEIAVATVPGYPDPMAKCFTHEREYVDRYGYDESTRPIGKGW